MTGPAPTPAEALEVLLAERAVERVLREYCRAVDALDLDRLRAVFHPDALDDHGVLSGNALEVAAGLIKRISGSDLTATRHHLTGTDICIVGTTATAVSDFLSVARRHSAGGRPEVVVLSGQYFDDLEDRGTGWRISSRVVAMDVDMSLPASPYYPPGQFPRPGEVSSARPTTAPAPAGPPDQQHKESDQP